MENTLLGGRDFPLTEKGFFFTRAKNRAEFELFPLWNG